MDRGHLLGVARSNPAWSPDGRSLAWTELEYDDRANESGGLPLVIHDLARNTARRLHVKAAPLYGVPFAPDLLWAKAGLVVNWPINAPADLSRQAWGTLVLDTNGGLKRSASFSGSHFLREGHQEWLASLGHRDVLDLRTGERQRRLGTPSFHAASAPDGWRVEFNGAPLARSCDLVLGRTSFSSKECPIEVDDASLKFNLAISPDGKFVAYATSTTVFVRDSRGARPIMELKGRFVDGLVWSPLAFRVR